MKNWVLYSALLLPHVAPVRAVAQDIFASWLPARVGDKGIFQNESRDGKVGGVAHPIIARWRTVETIVRTFRITEGTVIVKRVSALDPVPESVLDHQSYPHDRHYLVHQSCVYMLDYFDEAPGIDEHDQLTPEFSEGLLSGKIDPDLCFPLHQGKTWGNNPDLWKVVGVESSRHSSSERHRVFHIFSSNGGDLTSEIWFKKGVGMVLERTTNKKPYWQNTSKLIGFEPAQ